MNQIDKNYLKVHELQQASLPYDKELTTLIVSLESSMHKIIDDMSIADSNLVEDLMQEGRLSVCKALAGYVPNENTSFYTFAYQCIRNGMLDYLRKQNSKKNIVISQAVPLDNINENEIEDPNISLEDAFDNNSKIEKLMSVLDDTQKKIVSMLIEDYSYDQMAKVLNKNTKYIDNSIQKIKKICKSI